MLDARDTRRIGNLLKKLGVKPGRKNEQKDAIQALKKGRRLRLLGCRVDELVHAR